MDDLLVRSGICPLSCIPQPVNHPKIVQLVVIGLRVCRSGLRESLSQLWLVVTWIVVSRAKCGKISGCGFLVSSCALTATGEMCVTAL